MEQRTLLSEDPDYRSRQEEVQVGKIGLKWGTYTNTVDKVLTFQPKKAAIVSHYRLVDDSGERLGEKQFVVYREPATAYELFLTPTKGKPRQYFELALDETIFNDLVTPDNHFLTRFERHLAVETPAYDFTAAMTPVMQGIIVDMQHAPFAGRLKEVYLEAKAMELFLLQVQQLDRRSPRTKLSAADIERLHFIREEMTRHFEEPWSILLLARSAGINATKLKSGFLELFGMTVFDYLTDIRMQEARRLLVEERLYVGEVAERMGYQHAHHFTAAFRRKFGVLPREVRRGA